ncbi:MAG: hypothetical protein ISS78_09480 [Phycisphaerae bacterium]|nr:hypothetical protein [Phycisphaerae bacterium]
MAIPHVTIAMDVLILNTAVLDLRSSDFDFVPDLVGPGGLAKCSVSDMPDYTPEQYERWIRNRCATAGGPGNTAPLLARAGLSAAVGANLGKGDNDGLDVQGHAFRDILASNGVDVSQIRIHPSLPTGTTFIYDPGTDERGGIAYFPNANDDFDFEHFKTSVERLLPTVVYYMYSGLSARGDANGGRDLADFVRWCRQQGSITIVDSHTLTSNPQELIEQGSAVEAYYLLEPLLGEVDIFFSSLDEAEMIMNTLDRPRRWSECSQEDICRDYLGYVVSRFAGGSGRSRLFGLTVADGAFGKYCKGDGSASEIIEARSRFMGGQVIDLVGAGDSFRAGLLSYLVRNVDAFRDGNLNVADCLQMGNLFASLYIKAPLGHRYANIKQYDELARLVSADGGGRH